MSYKQKCSKPNQIVDLLNQLYFKIRIMTQIDFWHADEDLRNLRIVCKFKVECI